MVLRALFRYIEEDQEIEGVIAARAFHDESPTPKKKEKKKKSKKNKAKKKKKKEEQKGEIAEALETVDANVSLDEACSTIERPFCFKISQGSSGC